MLCGHRADAGARSRGRRWDRLAWQKHDVIESRIRDLVFPSGNFDVAGFCAGYRGKKLLRTVHALHRCLSDRCDYRAAPSGCVSLHFLPDDRIKRFDPNLTEAVSGRSTESISARLQGIAESVIISTRV